MRVSIRKQLLKLFMPFLFGLWISSALFSYWLISTYSGELFDKDLVNSADSVVGRLRVKQGKVVIDLPPAAQAILKQNESDKFYYRVVSSDGQRIAGDENLPKPAEDLKVDIPKVTTAKIAGNQVRLAEIKVIVEDMDPGAIIVQVAETTNVRTRFQQDMLLSIAVPQLLVIAVGLLGVWYGVAKILTPLKLLQTELGSRSQSDLSAVCDNNAPQEVYPLVRAINHLLSRLAEEIKTQQRFISNAAHQLRTPLAGLKTYSSIGTEMNDVKDLKHIIRELDIGIDRASRMVSQLLVLARTDAAEQSIISKVQLDLNFIVSDVTTELIDFAVRKGIDLVYEASEQPAIVLGELTGLRQLVTNIVENALMYTNSGGTVRAQIFTNDHVILKISDTGTGIPVSEREKVFERFYRVDGTQGNGSGLGLAIVKEVANAHSASISIDSGIGGVGTLLSIEFPSRAQAS